MNFVKTYTKQAAEFIDGATVEPDIIKCIATDVKRIRSALKGVGLELVYGAINSKPVEGGILATWDNGRTDHSPEAKYLLAAVNAFLVAKNERNKGTQ